MRLMGVKKGLALCLALVCLMSAFPAQAESYPFVGFAAVPLNLRDYPDEAGKVIATIPAGDAMIVTGEYASYYVAIYGGEQGYALKTYDGRWHLTPEGFLVSNTIISDLLLIQDKCESITKRR